jgi:hypothetical protein
LEDGYLEGQEGINVDLWEIGFLEGGRWNCDRIMSNGETELPVSVILVFVI